MRQISLRYEFTLKHATSDVMTRRNKPERRKIWSAQGRVPKTLFSTIVQKKCGRNSALCLAVGHPSAWIHLFSCSKVVTKVFLIVFNRLNIQNDTVIVSFLSNRKTPQCIIVRIKWSKCFCEEILRHCYWSFSQGKVIKHTNSPNSTLYISYSTRWENFHVTLLQYVVCGMTKIWCLDSLQVAKDSSVEKLIDKIKNWYFEKEGKKLLFLP